MTTLQSTVRRAARHELAPRLGGTLIRALMATTRATVTGHEVYRRFQRQGQPVIYILWHGRLLPLTYARRGEGTVALISRNRDGEHIAGLVTEWGYEAVRGSSSRGGMAALRQLVRRVREGKSIAITPDGPRGPREQMKPGALLLAQLTGAPVVPVAAGTDRGWYFGRWDRFLVPKPFSHIRIAYGEPLYVPRAASAEALEELQTEAQASLDALTRAVDER